VQTIGAGHAEQRVMITSQNHGFAVDIKTLPKNARGRMCRCLTAPCKFELTDKPAFCFQVTRSEPGSAGRRLSV